MTAPVLDERRPTDPCVAVPHRDQRLPRHGQGQGPPCAGATAVAIAAEDIRVTMPPHPYCFEGLDAIKPLLERAFGPERDGDWRLVPTMANRMPAAASYLRRPGDTQFRAFKLDVLRIEDGAIREITTFGVSLFPAFGLAMTLAGG